MNRIISLFFALSLLASCGQNTKKTDTEQEPQAITVSDFLADAGPFVEQPVEISGTVVHVCRHGGQRLFIVGEDGEKRIRITTGEDIAEFDVELEGETVFVNGVVKELIIDETYLAEWEAELMVGGKHDRGEGHEGGVGHGDDHGESPEAAELEDGDHDEEDDDDGDQDEVGDDDDNDEGDVDAAEEEVVDAEKQLQSQLARIQDLRDEIAESGKDHLSDYWIETIEFKIIED